MQPETVTQVLNDPIAQELIQSDIPARLAYTTQDGSPRVIPIGFHWNGAEFILCTVPDSPKVRALSCNPHVAMTVDTNSFPPHVLLVRGTATQQVVDGMGEGSRLRDPSAQPGGKAAPPGDRVS